MTRSAPHRLRDVRPTILVVGPDPRLAAELAEPFAALGDDAPRVHTAESLRQGLEAVRDRLPQVVLVELGTDIDAVAAFAREVSASAPGTIVAAVYSAPAWSGNDGDLLIGLIRAGVKDFLRRPVSLPELRGLLSRVGEPAPQSQSGRIVAFVSNKGGVGKSTTSVNVACGLARRHPGRVLLIDASLQLGVCASLLDVAPTATLADAARQRERLDETLLGELTTAHPCGLALLAAPRDAVEGTEVDEDALARVLTLARRRFDFVIVDTFPMIDRIVLAILDMADRTYVVLESVVPTLLGGQKLLSLLRDLGYPDERQRLVLNRYFRVAGGVTPRDVARQFGRPVDFVLPYDKRLLTCANTGEPFVLRCPAWYGYGARLRALVKDLERIDPPRDLR